MCKRSRTDNVLHYDVVRCGDIHCACFCDDSFPSPLDDVHHGAFVNHSPLLHMIAMVHPHPPRQIGVRILNADIFVPVACIRRVEQYMLREMMAEGQATPLPGPAGAGERADGGMLRKGHRAVICDLVRYPALNGELVTLDYFDDGIGRWAVSLVRNDEKKSLRPVNLTPCFAGAGAAADHGRRAIEVGTGTEGAARAVQEAAEEEGTEDAARAVQEAVEAAESAREVEASQVASAADAAEIGTEAEPAEVEVHTIETIQEVITATLPVAIDESLRDQPIRFSMQSGTTVVTKIREVLSVGASPIAVLEWQNRIVMLEEIYSGCGNGSSHLLLTERPGSTSSYTFLALSLAPGRLVGCFAGGAVRIGEVLGNAPSQMIDSCRPELSFEPSPSRSVVGSVQHVPLGCMHVEEALLLHLAFCRDAEMNTCNAVLLGSNEARQLAVDQFRIRELREFLKEPRPLIVATRRIEQGEEICLYPMQVSAADHAELIGRLQEGSASMRRPRVIPTVPLSFDHPPSSLPEVASKRIGPPMFGNYVWLGSKNSPESN